MKLSLFLFFMTKSTRVSKPTSSVRKRSISSKARVTMDDVVQFSGDAQWYQKFTKSDPLYDQYMSTEWGIEKRGDIELFEKLSLEGAQSGLTWRTILYKRDAYRSSFHNFDIHKVASMSDEDVHNILNSNKSGHDVVVRHRGKIESVIHNAKCILSLQDQVKGYTSFTDYLWSFVDNKPILNAWKMFEVMPSKSKESEEMSKSLKKLGFKFVGPTTCYSLMQSCGFVIDHPVNTKEWLRSVESLRLRKDGFQDRR